MNCDRAKSLLAWFYDGELDSAERSLVADHLEHCPDCAAELAALKEWDRAGVQLPALDPPVDLWDRVAARLPARLAEEKARRTVVGRRRFLWAAGILGVVGLGGLLAYAGARRGGSKVATGKPGAKTPTDAILMNLAVLGPEDRRLAEKQHTCAANCDAPLGADGPPIKVVLQNEPVFCCCPGCAKWAQAHPTDAIAKLHTLEKAP
jgi:anti-sigma factor RsiW